MVGSAGNWQARPSRKGGNPKKHTQREDWVGYIITNFGEGGKCISQWENGRRRRRNLEGESWVVCCCLQRICCYVHVGITTTAVFWSLTKGEKKCCLTHKLCVLFCLNPINAQHKFHAHVPTIVDAAASNSCPQLSSGAHNGETAAAAEEEDERITYLSTQRHKNWSPPFKHGSWTVVYLTR